MNPLLIKNQLVKELGNDVLKRIKDMKDDDRSSYLYPIVYEFNKANTVGYILNSEVISIPEHYNNWQLFNNHTWDLICKFDERALSHNHLKTADKYKTTIDIRYTIRFDGNETIEEVIKIIEQHPTYGRSMVLNASTGLLTSLFGEHKSIISYGCFHFLSTWQLISF